MQVSASTPPSVITMSTTGKKKTQSQSFQWWLAKSKQDKQNQLLATAVYLKESQAYRYKQATVYARLYGNQSLFSFIGSTSAKLDSSQGLPADRPTFNLIQSCTDTLVSRISQSRPSPVFLTDNSDYKERNLAKKYNNFIQGEFYGTKAYDKGATILRDALVEGTGCLKVYRTEDDRVGLDRVLLTELLADPNECINGEPRQLFQIKLVDRKVLEAMFPEANKQFITDADRAYVDNSADASKTVSDLVMVVEGWHLPSGKDKKDGRHTIACSAGVLHDEEWDKEKFPFVFLHFSPRLLGFWAQGLAEQLMGTQVEINSLLFTISRAIKLVGVPRIFMQNGSKIVKSHFNNEIGTIITHDAAEKPTCEVWQSNAPELYEQLQRLINYGFQQSGVSSLDASAQKPAGLNSGEAIRTFDDIATDRFAALSRRYDNVFIDLAYLVMDVAKDIVADTGKYSTVYPNKNSAREIDLTKADLVKDSFVIQCYNMSSLPRDPAGRMAKVTEMIQGGMLSIKEGRRLLDFPDLQQMENLVNASEERIYKYLDEIVEDGIYTGPDTFMDLGLAQEISVQYYNLYAACKLEEDRCEMIQTFFTQAKEMKDVAAAEAQQQAMAQQVALQPQAAPQPQPTSPLVPNGAVQ